MSGERSESAVVGVANQNHGNVIEMKVSSLEVGRTYYRLTFADRDMTIPGVEPWVFLGTVDLVEGSVFAFQDTASYVRFGSRLKLEADHDEICVFFQTAKEVAELEDIHGVARAVAEAAERAMHLDHPVLPVLRDEWRVA